MAVAASVDFWPLGLWPGYQVVVEWYVQSGSKLLNLVVTYILNIIFYNCLFLYFFKKQREHSYVKLTCISCYLIEWLIDFAQQQNLLTNFSQKRKFEGLSISWISKCNLIMLLWVINDFVHLFCVTIFGKYQWWRSFTLIHIYLLWVHLNSGWIPLRLSWINKTEFSIFFTPTCVPTNHE